MGLRKIGLRVFLKDLSLNSFGNWKKTEALPCLSAKILSFPVQVGMRIKPMINRFTMFGMVTIGAFVALTKDKPITLMNGR